jgi:hypothetical protein
MFVPKFSKDRDSPAQFQVGSTRHIKSDEAAALFLLLSAFSAPLVIMLSMVSQCNGALTSAFINEYGVRKRPTKSVGLDIVPSFFLKVALRFLPLH